MSSERYSREEWRRKYSPVTNWDQTFLDGHWGRLSSLSQSVRHAAIAGYVHKLSPRGHILDAGCGEGVLIEYLDLSRIDYTGFDLSPTAIDKALTCYPGKRLFTCAIEDFAPPEGEKYDQVVFNDSLASLDDPIGMIDRFATFLSPGGHVIVSQFQPQDPADNGSVFTRFLEAEIEAQRYHTVVRSEVCNRDTDQRWRAYCLRLG